mmetsp:Transcript_27066/g.66382  ORF Transcript_27066/g.66382 Transcript_27066/m.66382 type:complete len:120 (+) Transcript_27066:793-1152(+)
MREVDPDFWDNMTAVAFTYGFMGTPHIDTENLGCFYGLSVGDFGPPTYGDGGGSDTPGLNGAIAVESGVFEVTEVDTRGRLGKVEGRNPHWVTPYSGERYSLVYYRTEGEPEPHVKFVS